MTVHALSPGAASAICNDLAHRDKPIRIAVRIIDRIAHLYPIEPVTTTEEVTALAAFLNATDSRIAWHEGRPA